MTKHYSEVQVHQDFEIPFEHIKEKLMRLYMQDFFPSMIGDGQYHVVKFDYYINDDIDYVYSANAARVKTYRLICHHETAQIKNVTIASYEPVSFDGKIYKLACRWCGAEFHPSHLRPGTCVSCGGPK